MNVARDLDVLTCGGFYAYRDGEDRPRLLDLMPVAKPSALSKRFQKLALAALEAGREVTSDAEYRAWDSGPMNAFWELWFANSRELGLCAGDEGDLWRSVGSELERAVKRPEWSVQ